MRKIMLPGPLRIDDSTKSNTLSSISLQPGRLSGSGILKLVDSLVDVFRTTIFTVLTQKFQKIFRIYSVPFHQKSQKFGFWYENSSNHFRTKLNRFYLL